MSLRDPRIIHGSKTGSDDNGNPVDKVIISQADNAFIGAVKATGTNGLVLQIWNPLTSGVNARVVLAAMEGNGSTTSMCPNSSAVTTDISTEIVRTNIGGDAALCELRQDDVAIGAGIPDQVDLPSVVGIGANNVWADLDAVIGTIIPPGYGLVLQSDVAGANTTLLLKWVEVPV